MFRKILIALALIVPEGNSFAQSNPCQSFTVGETVSTKVSLKMFNYKASTASLSDFRKKLIILDFWATWCTSCIAGFEKLNKLQKHFGNDVQILLVNSKSYGDTEAKIKQVLQKWTEKKKQSLIVPTVVEDEQLKQMFTHKGIPHCVWISEDGIVRAITGSEEVTEENIRYMLSAEDASMPVKTDIDSQRPLFTIDALPGGQLSRYSIFLKGFISGTGSGYDWSWNGMDAFLRISFRNLAIPQIYNAVVRKISGGFVDRQILFEVKDSSKLFYTGTHGGEFRWQKDNLYTFDFIAPSADSTTFHDDVIEALNRCTGYKGKFETRKTKCLALVRTSEIDKLKPAASGAVSKQDYDYTKITGLPMNILVKFLNEPIGQKNPAPLLIVDETGYKGNVDIELAGALSDLHLLRKNLQRYDLDLLQVERELQFFVVEEKQ